MCVLLTWILASMLPVGALIPQRKAEASLEGRLKIVQDKAVVVTDAGKSVPLVSDDTNISATLQDRRLSGRQVKLMGRSRSDGSFSIEEFFIVRNGALYRLVYFCSTCNITTYAPGKCACCQQETVPVEVSPKDPRVYHKPVEGPQE